MVSNLLDSSPLAISTVFSLLASMVIATKNGSLFTGKPRGMRV